MRLHLIGLHKSSSPKLGRRLLGRNAFSFSMVILHTYHYTCSVRHGGSTSTSSSTCPTAHTFFRVMTTFVLRHSNKSEHKKLECLKQRPFVVSERMTLQRCLEQPTSACSPSSAIGAIGFLPYSHSLKLSFFLIFIQIIYFISLILSYSFYLFKFTQLESKGDSYIRRH